MHFSVTTKSSKEIVNITDLVDNLLIKENHVTGLCVLFVKHTTACLTTADLDPGTDLDMLDAFDAIMPKLRYRHPHDPTHVTDHILSSIIGPSLTIPVKDGRLDLGTWQQVVLIELDGPREREITLSFIKSEE